MEIKAVIGKNFGDEGKGLAVDYFASASQKGGKSCLVVKHNGGAQAGHTVDFKDKRFVFHQLSSGSFRNADTLWYSTYLPDLFKLQDEIRDFKNISGFCPKIYAFSDCRCVYIDDIILNMMLETSRGENRHGSCGMGINEAVERSKNTEYALTLGVVKTLSLKALFSKLKEIRNNYLPIRIKELGLDLNEYSEFQTLISNDDVLYNNAQEIFNAAKIIGICDNSIFSKYDEVIFESAQGLMLDEDNIEYAPHLTTSKTGLTNINTVCKEIEFGDEIEAVYVTRTYVTRHGAGKLPYEYLFDKNKYEIHDKTNMPNEWQGALRFAPHSDLKEFLEPIKKDINNFDGRPNTSLFITHLNETKNNIYTKIGEIPLQEFLDNEIIQKSFNNVYISNSPFSENTEKYC